MEEMKSPIKQIREQLKLTQSQFAAVTGASKGHMSEVEAGIASLGDKIKSFLEQISVDVDSVEDKHKAYMEYKI